ncbi:MAG: MHS family MFS transporter [Firmicutes bacterium]|nr:MHS family MFS transporter [Bacillota bacterium]
MKANPNGARNGHFPVRAMLSGIGGSALEWYDFFLYGTASSLVFPKIFFTNESTFIALILSYATFAIAFFSRPLGSALFARIGDRIGRKATLVVTTVTMGIGTTLIGLLPGYSSIGIWAPILLIVLRFIQGIALGGEWGGGMLLVTENASRNQAGLYGSLPQMGLPIGLLLGGLLFEAVNPNSSTFLQWSWRLPFLITIIFTVIVLVLALGLDDPKEFEEVKRKGEISHSPLKDALKYHWPAVLKVVGTRIAENASYYILTTFLLTYATSNLHYSEGTVINATNIAAGIGIVTIPLFGYLSDKVGTRFIFICASAALAVFAVPYYYLMGLSQGWMLFVVIVSVAVIWTAMYAVEGGLYTSLFPTRVRYSGVSFGYQAAGMIAGGPAPTLAAFLTHQYSNSFVPIAVYLIVIGLISMISAIAIERNPGANWDTSEGYKPGDVVDI